MGWLMLLMLLMMTRRLTVNRVEEIDISAEGLKTALTRLHNNDVRYRFCLVGYEKAFGA